MAQTLSQGLIAAGNIAGRKALLLKPMTYMNESGRAVGEAMRYLKLPEDALVVVHDELDLAPGKIRVKTGGGDAGHNGLRSITATLGPDYRRLRIGIGHPGKAAVLSWALRDFSKADREWLEPLLEAIAKSISYFAKDDDPGFMNRVALLTRPPEPEEKPATPIKKPEQKKPDKKGQNKKGQNKKRTTIRMGFKCGIVGLPNVGKSTLFNALTQTAAAQAANYPFRTIEPNVGDVAVPDTRLDRLAAIAKSPEIIPTRITFVDIAGLVRGASKGEGLGNQFLGTIREVDAIVHVLRCFEDEDVTHVDGRIDPVADAETVETELMLADLESLENRVVPIEKRATTGDKDAKAAYRLMVKALNLLREGKPARLADLTPEQRAPFRQLTLLTEKPVLYVCNVDEESAVNGNETSARVAQMAKEQGAGSIVISARIEEEVAQLGSEERIEYLESLGLSESGLNRMIRAGYELLGLVTFFTAGPKVARAWTITDGTKAPAAAGVIHTDFEKGFIRAETITYEDYVASGGEAGARDAGKFRLEGKEYVVKDGDVLHIRAAN